MSDESSNEKMVYWPRVKELLDGVMDKWKERWGREPLPGIHAYYWETPEELQASVLSGIRAIEPGVPGKDTQLVRSLARSVGTSGRMPLSGTVHAAGGDHRRSSTWIDNGMPQGPDC